MKIKILFVSICVALVAVSCKDKKKSVSETVLKAPTVEYSTQDTTEVMGLVNEYITYLKNQDYDALTEMLYVFNGGNVIPYTDQERDSLEQGMKLFPVYDAKLSSFLLRSEYNNQVGITIQLTPDGNINEEKGITKFYLNPVLFEGKWYLTILDKDAVGYEELYKVEE